MAISREKKEELVSQYQTYTASSSALIFTDYKGASVDRLQELRRKLSESNSRFVVVKNRLLKIVLSDNGEVASSALFTGPMAVLFTGDDIGQSVTDLKDFLRSGMPSDSTMAITGGYMSDRLLNAEEAQSLADLPTMPEIRAKLVGTLAAPGTQLTRALHGLPSALYRVISAPPRDLTYVLQARADQ